MHNDDKKASSLGALDSNSGYRVVMQGLFMSLQRQIPGHPGRKLLSADPASPL